MNQNNQTPFIVQFNACSEFSSECGACYANQPAPWFEQDMNPTIREYARGYVFPVKQFYPSMETQMAVWGTTIYPEDLIE